MPLSWQTLVTLSDAELARLDLCQVNRACAVGLPGIASQDFARYSTRIDTLANAVEKTPKGATPSTMRGRATSTTPRTVFAPKSCSLYSSATSASDTT